MIKIHLACGVKYKDGWHNVDINNGVKADEYADIMWVDFWGKIPDNSVDFFYNEHFIEHENAPRGKWFLKQCYKKLKPGGVLRIATPDLREVAENYLSGNWKNEKWLTEVPQGEYIKTGAEYLNIGMRDWMHQFLYDQETLEKYMHESGFSQTNVLQLNQSSFKELQNLETREDSKLIIEGIK
jgi:predicted SAM-dependent methyltransferase